MAEVLDAHFHCLHCDPVLVRGQTRPINDLAFSPRGWRLLTGGRDGSVRMFDCTACTGVNGLVKLARARLHEIVHAKR